MGPQSFHPGDPVPGSGLWARLTDRVRRLPLIGVPPLYTEPKPSGTSLRFAPPLHFIGVIQGFAGPGYSVAEAQFNKATGKWSAMPGGRTVTAYEYNLDGSIATGTAVEVFYSAADDWRFWIPRLPSSGAATIHGDSECPNGFVCYCFSFTFAEPCRDCSTVFEFFLAGVSVGTCSTSPPSCYCIFPTNFPKGTVLTWTGTDAYGGVSSGSIEVGCTPRVTHTVACANYPSTLTVTMTGDDPAQTIGALLGVPITLTLRNGPTCEGGTGADYDGGTLPNSAGSFTCCQNAGFGNFDCATQHFTSSSISYSTFRGFRWFNNGNCVAPRLFSVGVADGQQTSTLPADSIVTGSWCHPIFISFRCGGYGAAGATGIITE